MVGQVDARTKKRRSAEALAVAADARAGFAARQLGRELRVLFERSLPDGRWLGHAESHILVAAAAPVGAPGDSLENAIGLVRAETVDPGTPDRLSGSLLSLDRANRPMAEWAPK
jgi:tRNA A37 methylthiotransferase MiaB